MTLLPIVGRELALAARRAATYWLRFWAAAGALMLFTFFRVWGRNAVASSGHELLNILGIVTLGFTMFAGVFLTADSLSVEKREGTLGLLFLTDLKGYDVVLGKLAANSLHAFFGLLAVFPVLALPLLVGGAGGGEFWRLILVFTVTLLSSLSIGMFVSSASTDARHALGGTLLWIVVSGGLLPVLWWLSRRFFSGPPFDFLLWPSPAFAYMCAFDARSATRFGPHDFWLSLAVIFFMAAVAIAAASLILPRSWQSSSSGPQKSDRPRRRFFSPAKHPRRNSVLLDGNPFYWLALGGGASQWIMSSLLLVFVPPWAAFLYFSLHSGKSHTPILICFFMAIGLHLAAKVLMAAESGRRFNQDRQSGALELLLVTPLPVPDILAGQSQALSKNFKESLWVLGLVNLALAGWVLNFPGPLDMDAGDQVIFLELFAGGFVVLFLDFKAVAWVGMWHGLIARNHQRAALRTVGQIMALPWLVMFLLFFLQPNLGRGEGGLRLMFGLWFALGMIVDVVSIGLARQRLAAHFRSVVAKDF
jgi:ABC-type transport system involved in cytochrome c biogenesis permease component